MRGLNKFSLACGLIVSIFWKMLNRRITFIVKTMILLPPIGVENTYIVVVYIGNIDSLLTITWSKLTKETLDQGVKYIQSYQKKDTGMMSTAAF